MRRFRSIALVTAIAVGGLTVAALNPLDIGSATGAAPPTSSTASAAGRPGRAGHVLDRALDALVKKGTITADQAAAVKSAVADEVKQAGGGRHARPGVRGLRRLVVDASAKAIGVTPADLVKEIRGGSSIADVAKAKGVPTTKVVDAIVSAARARLDTAAANGKITAERKAKVEQRLPTVAERAVNRHRK